MPFNEVCDKYTILVLKKEHRPTQAIEKQYGLYKKEVEQKYSDMNEVQRIKLNSLIEDLLYANRKVWNAEDKIRQCITDDLPVEEYKWRTIVIKEANKLRVMFKNRISDLVKEQFKEVKVDHASEEKPKIQETAPEPPSHTTAT